MSRRAAILLLALFAVAADWPRFRGPNGQGHANDSDIPNQFGPNRNLQWKVTLPGPGNASPVVVNGKVFTSAASTDGTTRYLLAYDAATGKELWRHARPGRDAKMHRKNSLATATPTADDSRVVFSTWDGAATALIAFDHGGRELWSRDLGPFDGQHGPGSSPVIVGDIVVIADDQDGRSTLRAFAVASGEPRWQVKRPAARASYAAPLVRETANEPELIVASTPAVTAYDPKTGNVNWNWDWDWSGHEGEPLRVCAAPLLTNNLLIVNAGNGGGNSFTVALRLPEKGRPVSVAWHKRKGFPYVPALLASGDVLVTVGDKGVAGGYDLATGRELWVQRLGGAFSASPLLIDGKIFAVGEDGAAFVFTAGSKYQLVARNSLDDTIIATPAVSDGRLYIRGRTTLYCFAQASVRR